MSKKKKPIGHCEICGKYGLLTEEHVPPQSAYNIASVIKYRLDEIIDSKIRPTEIQRKIKGRVVQGGVKYHTLCESCNTNTGHWYGGEYVKWAKMGFDIITLLKAQKINSVYFTVKDVYPSRFIKQIVTCFFSVVGQHTDSNFAKAHPELVEFILDKNKNTLSSNYQFFLALYPYRSLRRMTLAGKLTVSMDVKSKQITGIGSPLLFDEITHPPFALIMMEDGQQEFNGATNITAFKNYKYDEAVELPLYLKIVNDSGIYPGGY